MCRDRGHLKIEPTSARRSGGLQPRAQKPTPRTRAWLPPRTAVARATSTPPTESLLTKGRQGRVAFVSYRRDTKGPLDWSQNQVRALSTIPAYFGLPNDRSCGLAGLPPPPTRSDLGPKPSNPDRAMGTPLLQRAIGVTRFRTDLQALTNTPPLSTPPSSLSGHQLPNHGPVGALPSPSPPQRRHPGQYHR